MIIGISGIANSGKDLLAKIIQYLTEGIDKSGVSYHEWNEETLWGSKEFDWIIVKFADPLKECAAIMLGCEKEDFEDRKFKENPLPVEWQDHFNDKNPLTPRKVLTLLGTDFARKNLSENVWINAVFSKYKEINGKEIQKVSIYDCHDSNRNDKTFECAVLQISLNIVKNDRNE